MYPARIDIKTGKVLTEARKIEPYVAKILTFAIMNHPGHYLDGLSEEEKEAFKNR